MYSTFGQRLKELRSISKTTQSQIAQLLEISSRQYQLYEADRSYPSFHGLILLADYFCVSLDYLTGRSNDSHHNDFLGNAEQSLLQENEIFQALPINYKNPDIREQIYSIEKRLKILFILRDMAKEYHESVRRYQESQKKFDRSFSNEFVKYSKCYLQKLGFLGPIEYIIDTKEQKRVLKRLQELNELLTSENPQI